MKDFVWARTGRKVARQWVCVQHDNLFIDENLNGGSFMVINTATTAFNLHDTLQAAKKEAYTLL